MATSDYASPAQARLMRAVAHGWKPDKPRGRLPSRAVANEFVDKKDRKAQGGLASAARPQRFFMGNVVRDLTKLSTETAAAKKAGEPFKDDPRMKDKTRRQFAKDGWTLAGGMWYPPEGTLGYLAEGQPRPPGMVGGYYVPQAPDPERLKPENLQPGSIAHDIYQKYGIIDPTWTSYDLTPADVMKEDPYAHMAPDDPARQEYESWDAQRGRRFDQPAPPPPTLQDMYPRAPERDVNPYRTQLREHKAKIEDILGTGNAQGGRVGYQMGGLAQFRGQMPRGRMRPMRGGRMNPQRMAMMRQRMMQKRGRGMPPKQVGMAPPRGGRVMPGGPGGMPGGAPEMISAARMPGGRAAPFRGYLQKMQQMRQAGPQGGQRKPVGMGDQQGGLSRAMQTQTGRPPISRRAAFPGSRQNQY